ncbi:recombinase family protein [Clostridium amylolyticum]|uniref:recombinase family protein n=1 Tax=Clostridium amylolyticum TaxID=1121298 RepID=UPI000935624A|nr:recombinase family protein [Clostridium amylolyticum]
MSLKVAIYGRKSVETDKGDSIRSQLDICKDYFLRKDPNTEFVEFEDEGYSGGNTNRPDFKSLMIRAKNREFDAVGCYKIDRIARNVVDFVNIYDELNKLDIKLISVTEGFDPSTAIGKLIMMILASFAEMERENIKQRVKDSMRELAKSGKWTGGTLPFGYTTIRVTEGSKKASYLSVDNDNVDLVKEIFNIYLETGSMHKVQKWLYDEKNIKWCLSTVKNILTSPVYVMANKEIVNYLNNFGEVFGKPNGESGILTYNRRPYTNGKHRWNDKSMFYSISKHNGIIEPNLWLRTQSLQEKNKVSPRPKASQISYLTGVLKCSKCKSSMTVSHNHKNKDGSISYVYICTGRKAYGANYCDCKQVKRSILDKEIEDELNSYVNLDIEQFKEILGTALEDDGLKNRISSIKKKIESNSNKINNLVDKLSMLSNAAGAAILSKIEILTKENEVLKKDLLFAEQEQLLNSQSADVEEKYEALKQLANVLDTNEIDIKRRLLECAVKEILWNSDTGYANIVI